MNDVLIKPNADQSQKRASSQTVFIGNSNAMLPEDHGILIRKAFVPKERRPIPLYLDKPLDCEWVGIVKYEGDPKLEIIFFDTLGEPREWFWRNTLAEAIEEAECITDCVPLNWQECSLSGIDDGEHLRWHQTTHQQ